MITLEILDYFGEMNSVQTDVLEVDGIGGSILLTMDLVDSGSGFTPLVSRSLPNIVPRISVARETNVLKAGS